MLTEKDIYLKEIIGGYDEFFYKLESISFESRNMIYSLLDKLTDEHISSSDKEHIKAYLFHYLMNIA